jgi:N6-adenosine-specific RNA methylase IME4
MLPLAATWIPGRPRKPIDVLLLDPPWAFGDSLPGAGRGAAKHYATAGPEAIAAVILGLDLPIKADAWLFLWRVGSQQREALDLAAVLGFVPKSEIVWVKTTKDGRPRLGMGRSVRNCHEICLVAKRGSPSRDSAAVPSVLLAPRGPHSAKPPEIHRMIERLTGPGPLVRVELCARQGRRGWHCWGNEVAQG